MGGTAEQPVTAVTKPLSNGRLGVTFTRRDSTGVYYGIEVHQLQVLFW